METCCTIIADTGSPEEGLTSQNLRNKIKQPCEFACPAEPKSKGLSMRPVSRCWQSCSPTSLRLWSFKDLTQISGFEGDENHRGTLMLVKDLPASAGKIVDCLHRMVLCYSDDEKNAAFAPSKSAKAKQQAIASESTKAKKTLGLRAKIATAIHVNFTINICLKGPQERCLTSLDSWSRWGYPWLTETIGWMLKNSLIFPTKECLSHRRNWASAPKRCQTSRLHRRQRWPQRRRLGSRSVKVDD